MKVSFAVIPSLLIAATFAQGQVVPPATEAPADQVRVVQRSRDRHLIERVSQQTLDDGSLVLKTNSYVQLGTGLSYWRNDQWNESKARFSLLPGGAVANEGLFQMTVAADISTEGAVEWITPDDKRFVTSPRWLVYVNKVTRETTIICAVKSCTGQLIAPNVILFQDAFDTVNASIRLTYQSWGVEQEIILNELVRPGEWGINGNAEDIVLEMWTELHTWVEPDTTTPLVKAGLSDVQLDFGQATIGSGKAFLLGEEDNSVPVAKTWTSINGKQFLIEGVRQSDVEPLLARLPRQAGAVGAPKAKGMARRGVVNNRAALLAGGNEILQKRNKPVMMAAIQSGQLPATMGFCMDYSAITTTSNAVLQGNTTYYVTNTIIFTGTTVIEGGCVVKFSNLTNSTTSRLTFNGPISCRTDPYHPAIFTGKDDSSCGDNISGSTGTGSIGTNRYALRVFELGSAAAPYDIHDVRIRYADKAIAQAAVSNVKYT